MKKLIIPMLFLASLTVWADNVATQSPITMQQLMKELRVTGGNWVFHFEQPVLARVECTVSSFPDGEKTETEVFTSDSPETILELYFMVAPQQIGEYPKPDFANEKTMRIKLSNCKETRGTRLIWFREKFSQRPWAGMKDAGQKGEFSPSVARYPELNKEYILYYYYREGDPYEVKATLSFALSTDGFAKTVPFRRTEVREFKNADE